MKIVDRKTFLAMPPETVFSKYEPCVFEPFMIKGESLKNDFFYTDLNNPVDAVSSSEEVDLLMDAETNGASVPLNFNVLSRDGCFDDDQLFAVLEPADVAGLIVRLQETQKP